MKRVVKLYKFQYIIRNFKNKSVLNISHTHVLEGKELLLESGCALSLDARLLKKTMSHTSYKTGKDQR